MFASRHTKPAQICTKERTRKHIRGLGERKRNVWDPKHFPAHSVRCPALSRPRYTTLPRNIQGLNRRKSKQFCKSKIDLNFTLAYSPVFGQCGSSHSLVGQRTQNTRHDVAYCLRYLIEIIFLGKRVITPSSANTVLYSSSAVAQAY